jgi:hypothetical protein
MRSSLASTHAIEESARGTIGQRCVHLVKKVLRLDELAAITVFESLQQDAGSQAGFPRTALSAVLITEADY